jgi:hypothetical protein
MGTQELQFELYEILDLVDDSQLGKLRLAWQSLKGYNQSGFRRSGFELRKINDNYS